MPDRYVITGPTIPTEDRSGVLGERLLRLLHVQAERDVRWLRREEEGRGKPPHDYTFLFHEDLRGPAPPRHVTHQAGDCALMFAVLALFGLEDTVSGLSREELVECALGLTRALAQTHPVNGEVAGCHVTWSHFDALRHDFVMGLAAWLLWDRVDSPTRLLLARMLEHDADSWCTGPAPAQLYDDTQAESNAWSSSGMAMAYCLLKQHPRREIWGEKAKELMISAYATAADVADERLVDGRPLNQWLTGPNAFPDHTVENHGIIHGDYLATVSEQVRTAVLYRLAGEPLPEAVLFNAAHVFDRLMALGLPDGSHLYMQGADYIARRLDSFYQACNVVPFAPAPLRSAAFLRALDSLEHMARKTPEVPLSGWLGWPYDLGVHWGTVENYLIRRIFGTGSDPLPDDEVDAQLAGVHVSEEAKYAVHRTADSLSSFSWHTTPGASQVMGLTLPLGRDVLVSPLPVGSYLGDVCVAGAETTPARLRAHRATPRDSGFGVTVELARCAGTVLQHSAFVTLPDGVSVTFEQRIATRALAVTSATSGNVAIFDDRRGPFQDKDRTYWSEEGQLTPDQGALRHGNWISIDGRLGYVAVGAAGFKLALSDDYMHSPHGDQYRVGLLAFSPVHRKDCATGSRISTFALVSCPGQDTASTRSLAATMAAAGWTVDADMVLALTLGSRVIYVNWDQTVARLGGGANAVTVPPGECGWVDVGATNLLLARGGGL